ncbi:hypothetical protein GUITHDRAFT_133222 [Guillardia theta CCMP2712]|uniref:PDZ domain-containing protein n=1 Tax=Guillardia theta (strain CCMP2712) TaxID=905079 RepID=L1JX69_GUITC|nr:hypothetical protein GUITHDRAFT_133222 [Guillardia theta CCMP2712]EKX52785.1 hypothetical protein GUITHDRAFT_133222 [Guillardia theta CCMP2712]|eukprot:XP_005839765.1 hypothetical protein GUITHDRAFT_133222 [Guillardia theta CCMP2712]
MVSQEETFTPSLQKPQQPALPFMKLNAARFTSPPDQAPAPKIPRLWAAGNTPRVDGANPPVKHQGHNQSHHNLDITGVVQVTLKRVFPPGIIPPKGAMAGIGVQIEMKELEDEPGQFIHVVRKLAPGGTAYESGNVFVGDIILAIQGTSVENQPLSTVIQAITGPQGSDVTLILFREAAENTAQQAIQA